MARMGLDINELGLKHKALEKISAGQRLIPDVPTIARLDGRAFHTLLRHAIKPFDNRVVEAMQKTACHILDEFQADIAYVQSDEITLVWKSINIFDGKTQKLLSLLSGSASVKFTLEYGSIGVLDCRIWQVADLELAAENIMWRELDATKNSVSMLASSVFSVKELHEKSTSDRITMLDEAGVYWNKLPHWLKKGSYYQKQPRLVTLTVDELKDIPKQHWPTEPILRSKIVMLEIPPAREIANFSEVLFKLREPITHKELSEHVAI
jgi:tRNA(His) guanylyltransferase